MMRAVALVLSLVSVVAFPAPIAGAVAFAASFAFPPSGLLAGALSDALYRAPAMLPLMTLYGVLATALGYLVQHIVRTRIIGA